MSLELLLCGKEYKIQTLQMYFYFHFNRSSNILVLFVNAYSCQVFAIYRLYWWFFWSNMMEAPKFSEGVTFPFCIADFLLNFINLKRFFLERNGCFFKLFYIWNFLRSQASSKVQHWHTNWTCWMAIVALQKQQHNIWITIIRWT